MEKWMKKHKCNEICKEIPFQVDQELIEKLNMIKEKFFLK